MPRLQIPTLASALRELRKRVDMMPVSDDTPEESSAIRIQRYVDPNKWGVAAIESWSRSRGRLSTRQIWDEMVHYLHDDDSPHVDFRYFMDGIQRTTPIGRIRLRKKSFETVPIHLAQIGTVLLKREHRKLIKEDEQIRLLLEYPNAFVQSRTNVAALREDLLGAVAQQVGSAVLGVDTSFRVAKLKSNENLPGLEIKEIDGIHYPRVPDDELWKWCADPAQFRGQARRWTTRFRDIEEQRLYDNALNRLTEHPPNSPLTFVIKDGPLTHTRGGVTKMALGVIKSFSTIFLDRSQMTKVLGLTYGYRSPVFTKSRPEGDLEEQEIYDVDTVDKKLTLLSWYVRIRSVSNHDPLWGLLRIEMHADVLPCKGHTARWAEEDTQLVDAISRQLCQEVSPSSHPDSRWHNLIYPIKSCEFFLRSRILPHVTAHHLLGGM